LATAQPPFGHKYRRPQAKEYPSELQPLTGRDGKLETRYVVHEGASHDPEEVIEDVCGDVQAYGGVRY
jgi:hypothetical protein